MAKRFTDTNKYRDSFFRKLPAAYKLLWDYINHDCDHAGIWIVDFDIAQMYVGPDSPINFDQAVSHFNNGQERIVLIDGGERWLIVPFIAFQYGELNEKNKAHSSVLTLLRKFSVDLNMVLASHLQGAKDIDKDKELDKEYIVPIEFLKNEIGEFDFQVIQMNSGVTDNEEFKRACIQWSLTCEITGWKFSNNKQEDRRKLEAGLKKWLNTWAENVRSGKYKPKQMNEKQTKKYKKL